MRGMPNTNAYIDIARWDAGDDNSIGGAMVTGTFVYRNVPVFLEAMKPNAQLMQIPGAQITKTYIITARLNHMPDTNEGDRALVTGPFHQKLLNKWFVITSIDPSHGSSRRGNAFLRIFMQRIGYADHELPIA